MEYRLGEICEFQEGYVNPPQSHNEYFDGNIKWLRANDLQNGYVYDTSRKLTEKGFESAGKSAKLFKPNTLAISKSGTIGRIGILKDYMCGNRAVINIIPNENKVNTLYLYYFLLENRKYIENLAQGSVQKNLYIFILEQVKITLPSKEHQNKIVSILNKIDKKIELNNQINDNLYKLSEMIFDELYSKSNEWNEYQIKDLNLYTSDYVANGSFKSLAENVTIYDTKEYALFIRNTDLKIDFTQDRKYVDKHSYEFLSKSKLFGRELIISNVGDVGSVFLCPTFDFPMTLGNNVIMIDSKECEVNYNYYLYYFFKSRIGQHLIDGITGGSAQPKFNKTDFRNSKLKIPTVEDIEIFNKRIIPLYDKIENNKMENETLITLRDTLLTKLMNGEIDLDKIEI